MRVLAGIAALSMVVGGQTFAAPMEVPVDLSSWTDEGAGSWSLRNGDNAVEQNDNGDATVFFNGVDAQGTQLRGTIEVLGNQTTDDDFFGFVLGYQSGELFTNTADYFLIDWKKADQTLRSGAEGLAGLAISRVTGEIGTTSGGFDDAWAHENVVAEIQRGTTLGRTGWEEDVVYDFDLTFQTDLIEVFVDGAKELSITPADVVGLSSFGNGSLGFYNLSQDDVLYAGLTEQEISMSAIPVPAALPLALAAFGALGFMGRRRR